MAEEEKNQQRSLRRTRTGVVTSLSGQKTVQVTVASLVRHPVYGKFMRRRTRLAVHDPQNAAGLGDTVEIAQCRRISKNKSWRLVRVIKTSALREGAAGREG